MAVIKGVPVSGPLLYIIFAQQAEFLVGKASNCAPTKASLVQKK